MQVISIYFMIFMCFLLVGYYIVPSQYRYIFLLGCNFLFYLSWITDIAEFFPIIVVTLVTWFGARCIEYTQKASFRKGILLITILVCLGGLLFFKYSNFIWNNLYVAARVIGITSFQKRKQLFMPIGISFFTFQAMSYVFDIYKRKINSENNLLLYATYVTFFPTILSGPIERPATLLEQIKKVNNKKTLFRDFKAGLFLVMWGGGN